MKCNQLLTAQPGYILPTTLQRRLAIDHRVAGRSLDVNSSYVTAAENTRPTHRMATKNPSPRSYAKTLTPIESDPAVFSDLMHNLGVSSSLTFTDIWSIEEIAQLGFVSRPALALILVLPTKDQDYAVPPGSAEASFDFHDGLVWIPQTLHNACGLYAILHATCNTNRREFVVPDSFLNELIIQPPTLRSVMLEQSFELENTYQEAALRGSTTIPALDEEVDLHYVCFIKSRTGAVYEMDGDAAGPIETRVQLSQGDDLLEASVLECVRKRIEKAGAEGSFSLLALAKAMS